MGTILIIILFSAAYAAYKIVTSIIQQYNHLDDEVIDDYLHGRIKKNTSESRKVTAHLGICEQCRNKMVEQN